MDACIFMVVWSNTMTTDGCGSKKHDGNARGSKRQSDIITDNGYALRRGKTNKCMNLLNLNQHGTITSQVFVEQILSLEWVHLCNETTNGQIMVSCK